MTYDAMGRITARSDVAGGASWTYDSTRKHQVTQAGSGSFTYAYDANGNATSRNGVMQIWWSFNYPRTLATSSETAEFYYGPDRQKWKQTYSAAGAATETTYYFDNLVEQVNAGSVTDWRHYIYAGGQRVAVYSRDGTNNTLRYTLSDHQGSVSAITTSAGATYAEESFTAYGKRRDASDWSGDLTGSEWNTLNAVSRTGYTGHGQIGTLNLNHMNGRVQDAVTGVFLSADPYVTDPGLTQNYHRYGYVYNNPATFTDPSGFDVRVNPGCANGYGREQGQDLNGNCAHFDFNTGEWYLDEWIVTPNDPPEPSIPSPVINSWGDRLSSIGFVSETSSNGSSNDGGGLQVSQQTVGSVGVLASVVEHAAGNTTVGSNFRTYPSGWPGNQHVTTTSLSELGKGLGLATLGVGTALDFYAVTKGEIGVAHAAANLGVGIWGMSGGPFTAVPAAAYFVLDNFYPGGMAGALTDSGEISTRMQGIDPLWNHPGAR